MDKTLDRIKYEDWQKPLSSEDTKEITHHIMAKCLDDDEPGSSGHLLLRILYNIDVSLKTIKELTATLEQQKEREGKLVEALKAVDDLWEEFPSFNKEVEACRELGQESPVLRVWRKIRAALNTVREH